MLNGKRLGERFRWSACILALTFWFSSCSVPKLESPQCSAARDAVKRFYSFHFANDMQPTAENLKSREGYLTETLSADLQTDAREDYFTKTEDYPKAFRVGSCHAESDDKAALQVVLLWRDDIRNQQAEVNVQTVRAGDKWLIDKVDKIDK